MYIFTGILVAVVSDNFAYVYQIAANFSLVNREEIRKFKNAWAEIDVDRTGYIQQKDYVRFWQVRQRNLRNNHVIYWTKRLSSITETEWNV